MTTRAENNGTQTGTATGTPPRDLPTRIKLLSWGVNPSTEGDVIVDDRTVAAFASMQHKIGRERAPLDFEHNTVPGTPEYERSQEPRPIAAMGTPVVIPGEGVFLEQLSYTTTGETTARDFEDVSAAPLLNKSRVVVGLHSAALTRTGAVYGAHFAARDSYGTLDGEEITLASLSAGRLIPLSVQTNNQTPHNTMAETTPAADDRAELMKQLSAISGVLQTITQRLDALEKLEKAEVEGLSARLGKIETDAAATAAASTDAERTRIVALFASEGRNPTNPATSKPFTAGELAALDVASLRMLHANTPVTVPLSARAATSGVEVQNPNLKSRDRFIAAQAKENPPLTK